MAPLELATHHAFRALRALGASLAFQAAAWHANIHRLLSERSTHPNSLTSLVVDFWKLPVGHRMAQASSEPEVDTRSLAIPSIESS